jgi:ABC-type amino acid transport substrate-binding protein
MAARRVLRVVAADRPPLVDIRNTSDGGFAYSGMLIELLPKLLEASGIDMAYQIYPLEQGGGGSRLSNGSWTGIMGELTSGRADLALFPLTLTSLRANYIDATAPYMDAVCALFSVSHACVVWCWPGWRTCLARAFGSMCMCLCVSKCTQLRWINTTNKQGYALLTRVVHADDVYSFLLPFSWRTWLLLLTALVAVVIALSLLDLATRRARYRALERCYGLERAKITRRRDATMQYTIESIMMLLGQGGAPRGAPSWAVKIMFVCWAVFSVIMLCAYTANLTANLTVSQLSTTIKSLAELKQSGHLFGVPADSSVAGYFKNSSDALAATLVPNMIEYRDADDAVRDVRAGKIAAYASDYLGERKAGMEGGGDLLGRFCFQQQPLVAATPRHMQTPRSKNTPHPLPPPHPIVTTVVKGYASMPPCDLHVSGDDLFGPGQLTFGLPLHSKLTAKLDVGLIKLAEVRCVVLVSRLGGVILRALSYLITPQNDHTSAQNKTTNQQAGVLSDLRRQTFVENALCQGAQESGSGATGGLTPHNMYSVFALLAVGMLVAAAWAAAEVCYYNRLYPHVEQLKQSKSVGYAFKTMRTMRSGNLKVTLPRPMPSDAASRLESGRGGAADAAAAAGGSGSGSGSGSAGGGGLGGARRRPQRQREGSRARFAVDDDSEFDAAHFERRVRSEGSTLSSVRTATAGNDPFDGPALPAPRPRGGYGDDGAGGGDGRRTQPQ